MLNILVARFDDWSVDRKLSTQHFANGLAAAGHNVKFLSKPGNIMAGRIQNEVSFFLIPKRIPFYDILPYRFFTTVFLSREIKETSWDLVIIGTIAAYPILKYLNYKKLAYHMHDNFFKYNLISFERKALKRLVKEADVVLYSSLKIEEDLNTSNTWYIGQNLSDDFVDLLKAIKPVNENRKGIVYIGSVKNIPRSDWEELNNNLTTTLTVIGECPEEYKNLFRNIDWLGIRPHNEALSHLYAAKYGLFWLDQSKLETDYAGTNPMKYVEYYACGLQIVSLDMTLSDKELFYLNEGQLSLFNDLKELIGFVNSDEGVLPYPVTLENLLWTKKSSEFLKSLF